MRYQERIYIQNQFGIRNKVVPNVNMSSDFCTFSEPKYILSGATKIACGGACSCSSGYTHNNDICEKMSYSAATFNGLGASIIAGNVDAVYGEYGTNFFPSIQNNPNLPVQYIGSNAGLKDSLGNIIAPITKVANTQFWGNNTTTGGRLNLVGLSATTGEYVGFSQCIDIQEAGTYYIGLAADNYGKFKVNGQLIVFFDNTAQDNFKFWSIFEIQLLAGTNIIEVEGKNQSGPTSFGAEIYKPTSLAALTGSTTTGTTGLIFSTKDKIGSKYDLGTSLGYSCPSGYSLNLCSGPINCVKIEKAPCASGGTDMSVGEYVLTGQTSIPITFNFTGNTQSFTTNNATFKYELYKYNSILGIFVNPPIYKSDAISYSSFSGTNILNQSVSIDTLQPDGEYLVKGYYEFPICTDFLGRLSDKIDTLEFKGGSIYQLYEPAKDYYLAVINKAAIPTFISGIEIPNLNPSPLFQEVITLEEGETTNIFEIQGTFEGDLILILNGAILTQGEDMDYTYSENVVTTAAMVSDTDVITAVYNRIGGINIITDTINVQNIVSGATGTQGNSRAFYNTTTGKYEIYLANNPVVDTNIIVSINVTTLTKNIDYYQSTTDLRRIILEGDILIDDMISIIYYPQAMMMDGGTTANSTVVWNVAEPPTQDNGTFTLEVSTNSSFSGLTYSATTGYEVNVSTYSAVLVLSGDVGSTRYYRVKNQKEFTTLCGNVIKDTTYSEVVSIRITSSSINSY